MIEMHRVGATFTVAHRPNGTDSPGAETGEGFLRTLQVRENDSQHNILENTR